MSERKTLAWEDATSYAQGERAAGKQPTAWQLRTAGCRVVVREDRHQPDHYRMASYGLMQMDIRLDGAENMREAQQMALQALAIAAQSVVDGLPRIKKDKEGSQGC